MRRHYHHHAALFGHKRAVETVQSPPGPSVGSIATYNNTPLKLTRECAFCVRWLSITALPCGLRINKALIHACMPTSPLIHLPLSINHFSSDQHTLSILSRNSAAAPHPAAKDQLSNCRDSAHGRQHTTNYGNVNHWNHCRLPLNKGKAGGGDLSQQLACVFGPPLPPYDYPQ